MMKPIKVMGSKCMLKESLLKCINSCKQLKLQKIKSKNDKIRLLKTKMSVINVKKIIENYEVGENEKSRNYKPIDFSKRTIANKIVKQKIKTNEQFQCPNNMEPEKKIKKIPSKIFSRKFSKYKDVQRKLKAKFKSNYKSSGKFDQSSTKYKAYINKNKNNKNKSFLKYSMCSFGFNREILKKKRTVCPDLPGKGTYNHRFAYDDALQLQRKGIEVDVLYKVKNKTDSIYVINGEFLWTKNKRSAISSKKPKVINTADKITQEQKLTESLISLSIQEKAELAKMLKENERKKRLAKMALSQKAEFEREKKLRLEEFIRKRDLENIKKDLRAKEISKMLTEKSLKKKANDEKRNQKQMEIDNAKYNVEMEKLKRLKLQQNIASINNNNDDTNTTNDKQVINQKHGYDGLKVIHDSNIINDIGRWVLQNDGVFTMSWLKIVAHRIGSLDGRVDTMYKNKWMQIAIDKVVDVMTEKKLMSDFYKKDLSRRKFLCNKSVQVSPSFVIKNKRMMKCHKRYTSISIQKSPKFFGCPGDGQGVKKLHKVIKTEGSYFQVISMDAFGS